MDAFSFLLDSVPGNRTVNMGYGRGRKYLNILQDLMFTLIIAFKHGEKLHILQRFSRAPSHHFKKKTRLIAAVFRGFENESVIKD